MLSKSVLQAKLNARSGSGSRLFANASFRKLPELDARLERNLDDGSQHRLRAADHIRRSEEPHSVHKPDQAPLFVVQHDLVFGVCLQHQARGAHHEVGINRLPLRDLTCNALKTILVALGIDGGDKRGATPYEGPHKR